MDNTQNSTENVPEAVLTSVIQEFSKDPQARITKSLISPFSTSGVSGNNSFYRADLEWETSDPARPAGSISLLIKRWTPGGISQSEMGWSNPVEALAWQNGILHPDSLPVGVKAPIIASVITPDTQTAWVAMTDVSKELREYDRSSPLPTERLISLAITILSDLARFHAFWEQADRQRSLTRMPWLLPFKNYLHRNTAFYASILGKDRAGRSGKVSPVTEEDILNLQAFLDWLEPAYLSVFEELLVDRSRLVDCFADIPCTLLHGDLDDRNIGLSWSSSSEGELLLIDWEWMGCGPAAMDVAKLLIHASMMLEPGSQCPDNCWSDELPDHYYESYRLAGGTQLDYATWRRSYDLALIAQAVWPFPVAIGNILRTLHGKAPLPKIPGLSEEVTLKLLSSGLENRKTIATAIMRALHKYFL